MILENSQYKKINYLLFITIILVLVYSYFSNLDGDPSYLKRIGDWQDEGCWLQNPINKVRYNDFLTDDQSQSFFGAPLYNIIIFIVFKIFGVHFYNARLLSVILLLLTSIILFAFFKALKFSKYESLLYSLIYLLLYDNRINYQWSTPINLEIFFQILLIYKIFRNKVNDYFNIFLISILFLFCYFSKSTSLMIVPFLILMIIFDSLKLSRLKIGLNLIILIISISIPIILFNKICNYYYPVKYGLFTQLTKRNVNIDLISIFKTLINIKDLFGSLKETFKFPNSTYLLTIPIYFGITRIKFLFDKSSFKKIIANRLIIVLTLYVFSYIMSLIGIGALGFDRRQINLIPVFYIIFVYLIKNLNKENRHNFLNIFIFISIYVIYYYKQSLNLLLYLYQDHYPIYMIIILISFFLLNIFLFIKFHFKAILISVILSNLLFHLVFNRESKTLYNNSIKLASYLDGFTANIVGSTPHHFAIESNAYPVWILPDTTYPPWNKNYNLYNKDLLIYSAQKKELLTIDTTGIYRLDTFFLYPKFNQNTFEATNYIFIYKTRSK